MTLDNTDRIKSSDLTLEQTVGLVANNIGYRSMAIQQGNIT